MLETMTNGDSSHDSSGHDASRANQERIIANQEKILANQKRDCDTDERLRAEGWTVVRVWEHEPPEQAAKRISIVIEKRKARSRA
jgi:G:T-mismatch repair DNA endonuclease (very short patch repair protein)